MKKSTLIGLSILSVFILCSLSYNPIIAEKPIIESKQENILIENEDCECLSEKIENNFPRPLCAFLYRALEFIMDDIPDFINKFNFSFYFIEFLVFFSTTYFNVYRCFRLLIVLS